MTQISENKKPPHRICKWLKKRGCEVITSDWFRKGTTRIGFAPDNKIVIVEHFPDSPAAEYVVEIYGRTEKHDLTLKDFEGLTPYLDAKIAANLGRSR